MVTLRILDEEFDKKIENISLGNAFSMIEDYCIEHIIDEPKLNHVYKIKDILVLYGDNVTFEVKDYYEGEKTKLYERNNE